MNMNFTHAGPIIDWIKRNYPKCSVLDIGAATGCAVSLLQKQGIKAVGVEVAVPGVINATMMRRPVLYGSAVELPFGDNAFDIVMSTDVMEHLRPEDVAKAIAEQHRVVKGGGVLIMKIASFPSGVYERGFIKEAGLEEVVDRLHLTVRKHSWWVDMYKETGTLRAHSWGKKRDTIFIDAVK